MISRRRETNEVSLKTSPGRRWMICCIEEIERIRGGGDNWNLQGRIPERRELCTSRASEICIGSSLSL